MQGLHAVGQGDHEPVDHGLCGGRAGRQVGSEAIQSRHLHPGVWIMVIGQQTGFEALYLERREIQKFYWTNILDNTNRLLFCFNTFGVKHPL